MPFNTKTVMEQRLEFVMQSNQSAVSFSELCRRYNITRNTGYKWRSRYQDKGLEGLEDRNRRPLRSPLKTPSHVEQYIVGLRKQFPEWGSKKIHRILQNQKSQHKLPFKKIPSKKTITAIFRRHGLIDEERRGKQRAWIRFEHEKPNDLWQMDFKGHFELGNQGLCHPLTLLDDHSRFNLGLFASKDQKRNSVKHYLEMIFKKYGLPEIILADNGTPWGSQSRRPKDRKRSYTYLEKWLIKLQVKMIHGRPYHPQTQGKEERFHRTLKAELLQYERFHSLKDCQTRFDMWREIYNCQRPHESLDFDVPVSRYYPSNRPFPNIITEPQYDLAHITRRVNDKGKISFKGKLYKIGRAFTAETVALRHTKTDGKFEVYFYNQMLRSINLKK